MARSLHRRLRVGAVVGLLPVAAIVSTASPARSTGNPPPRVVKVLVIVPSAAEAQPWIDKLALTDTIAVPGLSPDYPSVSCNASDVCLLTTGLGMVNAAASVSALVFSGQLDLTKSYFLVAGLASIDPAEGTVGSAAWSANVVDFGLSWEIDARSLPAGWSTGYLGIDTLNPTMKPMPAYRTELYRLDSGLSARAFVLSKTASLEDSDAARAYRAHYAAPPATLPPAVVQCDTTTGDTIWHGALLGTRARAWTSLLTDGQGTYCTRQEEDNATITALQRGGTAQLLDPKRIAVLHAASSFDRPYTGQTAYDSLITADPGGTPSAADNLYLAGAPLVTDIVTSWASWQTGVPP